MARFEPIPVADLPGPTRQLLDAGIESGMYADGTGVPPPAMRLMAYNSVVVEATYAQSAALWERGLLDTRTRELMRIRSAQVNGCDACAAVVKDPTIDASDLACMVLPTGDGLAPREAAALRVVETLAVDHHAIDDEFLQSLLEHFSPAEVVEVVYYACVMLGQHRFHHTFRAYDAEGTSLVSFSPELIDHGVEHSASPAAT